MTVQLQRAVTRTTFCVVLFVCFVYWLFLLGHHHHHHLFAQNTIKIDNGYVNEQDRKAHRTLTSAHNITSTVERNTLLHII